MFTMSADKRGAIHVEQAYAQGKMLDNSSWKLPRQITPSDVDLNFDNRGHILVCELSRRCGRWEEMKYGQRALYEAFVYRGKILAVLLKHSVPSNKAINTRDDIDSFAVMLSDSCNKALFTPTYPGSAWPRFVDEWYDKPSDIHMRLMQAGMKRQLQAGT